MDPRVLRSLWPIFAAETREQLQTIGTAVLGLEQGTADQASEQLTALKREVHSLKGSAASLGLSDIEQLVHAIEDGLARCAPGHVPPPGLVECTLRSLSAIESALNRGDAGEMPTIEGLGPLLSALGRGGFEQATESKPKAPAHFRRDGLQTLEKLESSLTRLCSPGLEDRPGAVWEAVGLAELLKAAANTVGISAVESLASSIRAGFARMEESGVGASVAASDIAGALVQLRGALESLAEEAPVEPAMPQAEPEVTARSAAGRRQQDMDRAVRVSVRTLDSLALQVEQLAAGRAQQLRRAEAHRELMEQTNQALLQLERAAQQLALSGGGGALESLRAGVGQVRGVQKRLLQLSKDVHREGEQLALVAQVVRDDLRDLRMVPASQMLEPLKRTVRELAARLGKDVELVLAGGDVRIDRRIVDILKDPLLHLVRNALDHGIEPAAERVASGKTARGLLSVRVEPRGTRLAVVVEDDGTGLSPENVRATAVRRGLLTDTDAAKLTDTQAARLVFEPGFSTREQVTETSGRGVGLDVVQTTATRMQGAVDISFEKGQGTRFTIDLPLILAGALGLLVRSGTAVVAIPSDAVERVLRLAPSDVGTVAGHVVSNVEGEQLPFHPLSVAIGQPRLPLALESGKPQTAMVLSLGGVRAVFAIDAVVGQQEIVVRSLGRHLQTVTHLAGAAVLDDGSVVPVLNAPELLRVAAAPMMLRTTTEVRRSHILVCDDALTTRFAIKSLLEIAGYSVVTAGDGEEALGILERTPCQLVVSDWQMPRLDGIGLTRRIRAHPKLSHIPVILCTSLDSPQERAAGLDAGADGYLVKREVERGKLLDLVRQLLPASA
ncbi:response regulator [Vitiosangium sp. GDMCC 1.1324]|uniref:hybrid sensor histidine kinase/response regulator n=1 Tax=Vitiosangium sp. (strain GDMCC 1.1324) TaxID=2138576 RepID=UPI000D342572|nr:response regulator [Vitiosangium sp. GDMCC 1.1324]PTL77385.1 hybrid sensor histidine kinase/response regulator [Vitiosangium sp. GDMCC 1.1324]